MIRKLRSVSKFMTPQTGKQIVTVHILPHISRNKGNQTIKFSHSIEYSERNIFFEKYTKCDGEASLRPFHKNSKWKISLDQ